MARRFGGKDERGILCPRDSRRRHNITTVSNGEVEDGIQGSNRGPMSYGLPALIFRFLRPKRITRCPICGETDPAGMSPAKLRSHYFANHKVYYDWVVRWIAKLFISYGVLFLGLMFFLFFLGREMVTLLLPFLVLGYVLSGSIVYRLNTHRHEKVFAVEWAEKHGPPLP
jgi:hypothetical protein